MALPRHELRRRVVAAAALHGLGLRELRTALGDYGASKTLAEAMIRGEQPQNQRNIRDLAAVLAVPEAWFTAEDWRELIPGGLAQAEKAVSAPRAEAEKGLAETGPDIDRATQPPAASDEHSEGPRRANGG